MPEMTLMQDMVRAVANSALCERGFPADRVHLECGPAGLWLENVEGEVLGGVWRDGWWYPSSVEHVTALAEEFLEGLPIRDQAAVTAEYGAPAYGGRNRLVCSAVMNDGENEQCWREDEGDDPRYGEAVQRPPSTRRQPRATGWILLGSPLSRRLRRDEGVVRR